jgi:uncharacterized protein (TIGR00725 family)
MGGVARQIGVIGAGQAGPEEEAWAEGVGRELARREIVLLCGGLQGVMAAAARGARAEGGLTVGVLPGENRLQANPFIRIGIVTGMGHARNVVLVRSSDGLIAIGGGYGTLSEIAIALKIGKPVVSLGSWALGPPLSRRRMRETRWTGSSRLLTVSKGGIGGRDACPKCG